MGVQASDYLTSGASSFYPEVCCRLQESSYYRISNNAICSSVDGEIMKNATVD